MQDERVEIYADALVELQAAFAAYAKPEIARLADAVVIDLKSRDPPGTFGDTIAARHMWDEYCWHRQEGPFDNYLGFGSISDHWDDMLCALIEGEAEKLPRHALLFVSAHVAEETGDWDDHDTIGFIWMDGIVAAVREILDERASQRNLYLIGPHRMGIIPHEVEGRGLVWSALSSRNETYDVLCSHLGALTDPDADLSNFASELANAYMASAQSDASGTVLGEVLTERGDAVRALLIETDILPSLKAMRADLLEKIDG